ncbi:hypothetical protein LWM68_02255 [Niabella sp. W65]|nr:hypothetical protein [Niabella sp. W65]MCH7361706.1 hypothetical protein [Niabella sp. W65]ULT45477.1 hypothetical protein KRR40_20765 [Niabella sp. I65]
MIDNIQNAKNKPAQVIPQPLTAAEIASINQNHPFSAPASQWVAEQEKGTRPACALPYIIYADCHLTKERGTVELKFEAAANDHHIGTAFNMYTPSAYKRKQVKPGFTL